MLVHPVTPNIKFAATHFYARVERGTISVKVCVQKDTDNTMPPARTQTWTAPYGHEHAKNEATSRSSLVSVNSIHICVSKNINALS